ncbi:nucleoside-diphosphate sugar epimerase [Paenibacillus pinistramenti]|uniref:nucleoside-diphosphate sugar epimerase n=1 Tax=Paenibacillus pinistramenti TaxID=1768003 RepID=UPI001107CA46|nr:nucleoside-diphosphate sugar epimerase [Paenibacillus pinistramenti]
MEQKITDIVMHMAHSHQQLARIMDVERHITVRMAHIVHELPDEDPDFEGVEGLIESVSSINKSIISYLNSIGDLEESMSENLTHVMTELKGSEEE